MDRNRLAASPLAFQCFSARFHYKCFQPRLDQTCSAVPDPVVNEPLFLLIRNALQNTNRYKLFGHLHPFRICADCELSGSFRQNHAIKVCQSRNGMAVPFRA